MPACAGHAVYLAFLARLVDHFTANACRSPRRLSKSAPGGGDHIAFVAMGQQTGFAQFFDAGVQGVGGDAAHAVLQQAEGLGMAVAQGPQHANRIAGLQQSQQLSHCDRFFCTHYLALCLYRDRLRPGAATAEMSGNYSADFGCYKFHSCWRMIFGQHPLKSTRNRQSASEGGSAALASAQGRC